MKLTNLCKIAAMLATLTYSPLLISGAEPQHLSPQTSSYQTLKAAMVSKYSDSSPREWGESVSGVISRIKGGQKVIALTFDACGSAKGMKFDKALIDYLASEQVPATLFINGRWIEPNRQEFDGLAKNTLFEIANHGFSHKPASVNGRSVYGIEGTKNIAEIVDEIELNARKLEQLTGRRPRFYRSGTAYYDEIAVRLALDLGHQVAGFSLLGDAGATWSKEKVKGALLAAQPGDIVIMHFNHPESGTAAGVMAAIPELKKRGYRFVRLSDVALY